MITIMRYISFDLNFDVEVWAEWAEREGIDGRCINFLLTNPELLKKEGNVQTINPRSLVTFFNTISGFKDFSKLSTAATIFNIAGACFTSKENVVGELFTQFINNKLDQLPNPDQLLTKKWDILEKELISVLYDNNMYRADIGSVITTRFLNYVSLFFEKKGSKTDKVCDRIIEFIDSPTIILAEDLLFSLIKTLVASYPGRTNKFMQNAKISKKLL